MRLGIIILVVSALTVPTAALASHPVDNVAPGPGEPVLALTEMATDGYVLQISHPSARVFEARVLHRQSLVTVFGTSVEAQYAFAPVDVLAPSGNSGLWLHTLRYDPLGGELVLPIEGLRVAQTVQRVLDASGDTHFLRITIDGGVVFDPTFQGAGVVVVDIPTVEQGQPATDFVRGFYNPAKLAIALDALDAVPFVFRIP